MTLVESNDLYGQMTMAIIGSAVLGFIVSFKQYLGVKKVKMDGHPDILNKGESLPDALEKMIELGGIIQVGADAFMWAEYKYLTVFMVVFSFVVYGACDIYAVIAFVAGCLTSTFAGWIGMKIATYTNYRTTHQCWANVTLGYACAIQGGSVMGLSLVAMGLLNLMLLIVAFASAGHFKDQEALYEAIAGYGLGGSSIALFGRVGGGIYTKAADVGADLSGKIDQGMDEDDPRNPACIADNVGDNVGDIAGMGADLFGSFAESTCAALVVASSSSIANNWNAMMFPLVLSAGGIISGIITLLFLQHVLPSQRNC